MRLVSLQRLQVDTAWDPVREEELELSPLFRKALVLGLGPFLPWMSISHWLWWHFDLKKFRPNQVRRVQISLACVFAFIGIGWPLIIYKTGLIGWIKYWFMPWMGYHFWMSTFTVVHHTAPHIPFKTSDEWNAAEAQLNGTVHCNYPRWIEFLCHGINVHVPHHIAPKIPSYNLRAAYQSVKENWGKYLTEANWSWRLMKTIMTVCHVYNKERNYSIPSFSEFSASSSFAQPSFSSSSFRFSLEMSSFATPSTVFSLGFSSSSTASSSTPAAASAFSGYYFRTSSSSSSSTSAPSTGFPFSTTFGAAAASSGASGFGVTGPGFSSSTASSSGVSLFSGLASTAKATAAASAAVTTVPTGTT
ncbi:hypothetical protein Taro_025941, partial [Colocasia esculenta]|nr:hypothetical protein [Colocasia esculenta]